jgi:hypothetical protein
VPLHFLAADRDPAAAQHASLPHNAPDAWRRPYRPGPWRVAVAALTLLIAAYLLISAGIIAVAGTVSGGGATLAAAVLTIAFALRILRMGIWVCSRGLRRVGLLTTRTLRWREISRVSTVQQPVKWLGLPRSVQGQAVHIERRRGEPLRTLLTDHSADFLGRPEAFEQAADVLEAWAAEHGGQTGRG